MTFYTEYLEMLFLKYEFLLFVRVCVLSPVQPLASQAPLSMGFPRQECWSGLPFLPPRDLPDPGTEPMSVTYLALTGVFFTTGLPGKPICDATPLLPSRFSCVRLCATP